MAILVTRVSTGEDFEFDPGADARSQELTERLHMHTSRTLRDGRELVECRMHDESDSAELVPRRCSGNCRRGPGCRRVHGILVALVKADVGTDREEWTVRHYDKRDAHRIRVGEGDGHKFGKDAWCAAVVAGGGSAEQEVSLPSGRTRVVCDVLAVGPAGRLGIEVQGYHHTIPQVRSRTTRIRRAGVEPVWHPLGLTPWSERNAVPNVRTNDMAEFLGSSGPLRDQWLVAGGVVRVFPVPCHPRYGTVCLTKGPGRFCGEEHPQVEPLQRLRVYEAAERLLAGDLVAVKLAANKAELLMSPADRDRYVALGGAVIPRSQAGVLLGNPDLADSGAQHDATCTWAPREGFGQVLDQRRDTAVVLIPGGRPLRNCDGCGQPKPLADGLCLGCRLDGRALMSSRTPAAPSSCARCGRWRVLGDEWICGTCSDRLGLRTAS